MVTFLRTEVICYNRIEGLPSAPKWPMNFTLFVMGIVGGEIHTSPSCSCFLHSSNCIACQQKLNRCKDMAFTDWMNFISNHARGPLCLILSMTHFFLPSFSPVSKSIYCHWCHVTCLLQSTSGFCFIMGSCSVFIALHFLQFLKMQSQL